MKTTLFLAIIILISGCTKNKIRSDLFHENVHGNVKRIKDKIHVARKSYDHLDIGREKEFIIVEYDEQGFRISRKVYDSYYGILKYSSTYGFNNEGERFREYGDGSKSIYIYDNHGFNVEESYFNENGYFEEKEINSYKRGRLIETKQYNVFGNLEKKIIYERDKEGNYEEVYYYNNNSDKPYRLPTIYEYLNFDNRGNWQTKVRYESDKSGTAPQEITIREIEYY